MMDEGFPNFDIGDVESLFESSGNFSLDSPPILNDDPHVSSSVHQSPSVLGGIGGPSGGLLGPNDSHSNVSSTTTDHQATAQYLGHLDGISGTHQSSNHDDIFYTGTSSQSGASGGSSHQDQNTVSVGSINNLIGNNNGATSKVGPTSQQSYGIGGPSSVSASSMSNPSPQQPHTPHTPRSLPIPSPSQAGVAPMPSPANSVPMASPVASLPPPSPAQQQYFSRSLKSPASSQAGVGSINSPITISSPSPSPSSVTQPQSTPIVHNSTGFNRTSMPQASIIRSVAPVTQSPQIQTAQGQVLLSAQPTMLQGGSTMLTGCSQVVQQAVPTLIQTATGGLMQIALQPQLSNIGSVASPVNVSTSARFPLALNTIATGTTTTSLVNSLPQSATTNSGRATTIKQQPHLLPKHSGTVVGKSKGAVPLQYTVAVTQNAPVTHTQTFTTGASPLLLNTSGALFPTLQGVATAPPQQAANQTVVLGQNLVVGNAGQTNSPFLIQQPNGNPVIMYRSNPPTIQQSTPTILPIVSQAAGTPTGTLLLQQPQAAAPSAAAAAGVITAQPQVKIITPQGRMQVQQIQTPTGPKLITVPVGQGMSGQTTTLVQQTMQTAPQTPTGQLQHITGATAFASVGTPTIVSNLPNTTLAASSTAVLPTSLIQSVPTMGGMGLHTAIPLSASNTPLVGSTASNTQNSNTSSDATGCQLLSTPKSSGTKKKGKRKTKKPDPMAAATTAVVNSALEAVGQKPPTRSGGLDLGELMKDVGLDLEGFGVDEASAQAALSAAGNVTAQQTLPIVPQQLFSTSQDVAGSRNIGSLSNLTSAPTSAVQGISIPGGTLSMSGPSPGAGTITGATTFPILSNTQPVGAPATLNAAQGTVTSSGNQLVAQLQQPLPLQPTSSNQLQLVQGPDGQFILQSAPAPTQPTPTLLSQASIPSASLNQTVGYTNAPYFSSTPTISIHQPSSLTSPGIYTTSSTPYSLQPTLTQTNLTTLPTPILTSVIDAGQQLVSQPTQHQQTLSDLQLTSPSVQQLTNPQTALTSVIGGSTRNTSTNLGASATTAATTFNLAVVSGSISNTSGPHAGITTTPSASPTKTKRSNVDPNRSPLYLDSRLPTGWHRKVSQRKSGASAGRYEVFVIGPTGKRFRSRNEMRTFFEKTSNDSNIDPDDFDFSIFGSNNITSGRPPPKPQLGSSPSIPPIPPISASRNKTINIAKKSSAPSTSSSPDKIHLPDVIPTSSGGLAGNSVGITSAKVVASVATETNSIQTSSSMNTVLGVNNTKVLSPTLLPMDSTAQKSEPARSKLESDLMKNLEKIGMASVDAAKAARAAADQVRDGMDSPSGIATSELLQRFSEPLPNKPLTLPIDRTIDGLAAQERSNTVQSSGTNPQPFTTQLSMETAEADAQISQLLETLQKDPKQLVVEGEKMAEFINSLTGSDDLDTVSSSPIPPTPNDISTAHPILQQQPIAGSHQTTQSKVNTQSSPLSQQRQNITPSLLPSLLPQTLSQKLLSPGTSSINNNVINKPPELTSGTTGFQASFLNSLASTSSQQEQSKRPGPHELDSHNIIGSITTPVQPQQSSLLSNSNPMAGTISTQINQPVSKGEVLSLNMPTTPVSIPHHIAGASPVTLGGGAPSQMRAMQNLPQNTRLVRGPNGQYSLQKVHTIELSQEMQASLRVVQAKIQEIEQKSGKTPRDEAELAQLQTKQQQILSTGKPVEGLPQTPTFSPPLQVPSQISHQPTSAQANTSSSAAAPIVATKSAPPPIRYTHNVGNQAITLPPSGTLGSSGLGATFMPNSSSAPIVMHPQQQHQLNSKSEVLSSSTNSIINSLNNQQQVTNAAAAPTGGAVPPLTEQQKKIVHEFKQKMASLPQDQQATFIAEHKANLIKQLNFQPTQLQLLRSNHAASQQQQIKGVQPNQLLNQPLQPKLPTQPLKPSMINIAGNCQNKQKPLPIGAGTINNASAVQIPTMGGQGFDPNNIQQLSTTATTKQLLNFQPQLATSNTTPSILQDQQQIPGMILGGLKRPPPTAMSDLLPAGQPINKQKKIAWVESQIKKDQNEAVNPKYKTQFSSKEDACKRLLRYHVFDELDDSPADIIDAEEKFEVKSTMLLKKYRSMLDKYHYLLAQESMREVSSSEEVMLARLWDSDERQSLTNEKEEVKRGEILELPSLPEAWSRKYEEQYGNKPLDGIKKNDLALQVGEQKLELLPLIKKLPDHVEHVALSGRKNIEEREHDVIDLLYDDDDDVDVDAGVIEASETNRCLDNEASQNQATDQNDGNISGKTTQGSFLGLKFSRNISGTWNMKQKNEQNESSSRDSIEEINEANDYDEFESIRNELSTFDDIASSSISSSNRLFNMHHKENSISMTSATFKPVEDSDEDEEFSLRDVDTARAVGSILEGADDDIEDDTPDDDSHDTTGIHHNVGHDNISHHSMQVNSHHDEHQDIFYDDSHQLVGVGVDDTGDNDSVQNAINSILDTLPQGERMETPDLNNITGFLDSIDDVTDGVHDQERDPVTEAAVNSIL